VSRPTGRETTEPYPLPEGDRNATTTALRPLQQRKEGDLIIGKNGASAAITLVERTSRFTTIIALPEGKDGTC